MTDNSGSNSRWASDENNSSVIRSGLYRNQSLPQKHMQSPYVKDNMLFGFKREKMVGADLPAIFPIFRSDAKMMKPKQKPRDFSPPVDASKNFISKNIMAVKPKPEPVRREEKLELPAVKNFSILRTWAPSKPIQYNYSQDIQVKLPSTNLPQIRPTNISSQPTRASIATSVSQPTTPASPPSYMFYCYWIAPDNNGAMIERILSNRSWWRRHNYHLQGNSRIGGYGGPKFGSDIPSLGNSAFNSEKAYSPQFFWKTGVQNFNWEQFKTPNTGLLLKKCCNRFPRSPELGDKDNMYRNLFFHARDLRGAFDLQEVVPITFSFRAFEIQFDRDLQLFLRLFKALEAKTSPESVVPTSKRQDVVLGEEIDIYHELTGLEFPARHYKDRDKTFHNPQVTSDTIAKLRTQFDGQNLWIIKPSECDRGQGVEIFRSLDELGRILAMFSKGYRLAEYTSMNYDDADQGSPALKEGAVQGKYRDAKITQFVIQKYIERPALYKGYKFDIRSHAVLTQDRQLYIFRDSYIRLSSLPFEVSKVNYFAHLCNTAVNLKSQNFGKVAEANVISIGELSSFFKSQEKDNPSCSIQDFEEYFFQEIKKLVKRSFDAMFSNRKNLLNPEQLPNLFEMFGFDVMVDADYKCWLIEANFIPGLTDDGSVYCKHYFDRMMDDMFKITVDAVYPVPKGGHRAVDKYPLLNYPVDQNLWVWVGQY